MDTIKKIFSNDTLAVLHHHSKDKIVPFVLASASPTKQSILKALGLRFSCDPADIDETLIYDEDPTQLVIKIAIAKAKVVIDRHPDSLVLAADTLIFHEGKPMGKPKDISEAREFLSTLSGDAHQTLTGIALWDPITRELLTHAELSEVIFHDLTDDVIDQYIQTGEPMGRAGAYALQGKGRELVKSLVGDPINVYGLPVDGLLTLLSTFDYEFIPQNT